MTTDLQKRTGQAIVNIFETGKISGDYSAVTVHPSDPGHLTFGRSQVTLASGNLHLLLQDYCRAVGAQFAAALTPYLPRLAARDFSLDHDLPLRVLLQQSGTDSVMRDVQDAFFDRIFWTPAVNAAGALAFAEPLAVTVVYDSHIHGSWRRMRDRTILQHGAPDVLGEHVWIEAYIATRDDWLRNHPNELLRKTVYRTETFTRLVGDGAWALPLPLTVRGVFITADSLDSTSRGSADDERVLRLQTPYMVGNDVREVQEALRRLGYSPDVDGVYGPLTEAFVRLFQEANGVRVDGVVGPVTRGKLGL